MAEVLGAVWLIEVSRSLRLGTADVVHRSHGSSSPRVGGEGSEGWSTRNGAPGVCHSNRSQGLDITARKWIFFRFSSSSSSFFVPFNPRPHGQLVLIFLDIFCGSTVETTNKKEIKMNSAHVGICLHGFFHKNQPVFLQEDVKPPALPSTPMNPCAWTGAKTDRGGDENGGKLDKTGLEKEFTGWRPLLLGWRPLDGTPHSQPHPMCKGSQESPCVKVANSLASSFRCDDATDDGTDIWTEQRIRRTPLSGSSRMVDPASYTTPLHRGCSPPVGLVLCIPKGAWIAAID